MERSQIAKSVKQFGLGVAGLLLITFAAVRLRLEPGAVSLLYLIAVVFVSIRAGFFSSVAVSLVAAFLLQDYFVPLFSPGGSRNPLAIVASVAFLVTAWVITAMVPGSGSRRRPRLGRLPPVASSISEGGVDGLSAYQEVEDQLAALRILSGEADSTASAVNDAQQAKTIALSRYRNGLVSIWTSSTRKRLSWQIKEVRPR